MCIRDSASIDRGNGAWTTPLVSGPVGATAFLNGITTFDQGAAIGHHMHNCVESVMVIDGDAVVDIDGVETPLRRFDTTFVPANIPHHFRNASRTEPMRIFWTYASIDATRTVTATGETARVDAEQNAEPAGATGVLEVVELEVRADACLDFEETVGRAAPLLQRAHGCRTFELVKSVEQPGHYRLFIEWTALEDHTAGLRQSEDLPRWRALVMPHLSSPPKAEHFHPVAKVF